MESLATQSDALPKNVSQEIGSLFNYLNQLDQFEQTIAELLPHATDAEVSQTRTYAEAMGQTGWRIVCQCDAIACERAEKLKGGRGNKDTEGIGKVEAAKQEANKRSITDRQVRRNAQIYNTFLKPKKKTVVINLQSLGDKQFFEEALRAPEPLKAIRIFEKEKSENPNFTPADAKRLAVKLKENEERVIVPDVKDYVDPHFKSFLVEIENTLSGFRNRCPRPEFTIRLDAWIRATRFERARTPQRDYDAVKDQIERLASTPEEIAEEVYLSHEEIKAICKQIIENEPDKYEWRPIGVDTDMRRGALAKGIFRKDSPSYDSSITASYNPNVEWE